MVNSFDSGPDGGAGMCFSGMIGTESATPCRGFEMEWVVGSIK